MSLPQNEIGLPKSVMYDLPPSLSENSKSAYLSISPDGITQTPTVSLPGTIFTANSGTNLGSIAQQQIQFSIPCGGGPHIGLDTSATTLSFRLVWNSTTLSSATGAILNLISSGASFFDSLTLISNSTPIESINQYALLHHMLLQSTCNYSQRTGNISVGMGCDTNTGAGIDLPHSNAIQQYVYNFSIPLLSLIGISSMDKIFPTGLIQNLQLQMMTSSTQPFASFCTAVVTQPVISWYLDQFSLNIKQIDLGEMSGRLLQQNIEGGKIYLKGSSYINSGMTISSGSSGQQQLMAQIRNTSVKSMWFMFGQTTNYALCPNGLFDSVNFSLNSAVLECNSVGLKYPNKNLNPIARPAECFSLFAQSLGCSSASTYSGVVSCENYNVCLPSVISGSDSRLIVPAAGLRPAYVGSDTGSTNIVKYPNSFYLGLDMEKCTGSVLFNGVSTRSSPPILNITLAQAIGQSVNVNAFGLIDVVVCVDVESKSITVFN